jgi:uncharacterized protein
MAKPAGARCNVACRYCFYSPKRELYPDGAQRMSDETLSLYIRQMLELQPGPEVSFAWQGGEPTILGLPYFRRVVELQREHAQPRKRHSNTIQTNATLLTDEWCAFLTENGFLVGVSLDGPPAVNDAFRVDHRGRSTFDAVMRGVRLLQKHGVDFNILCTVHAANQDLGAEVYRFFRDEAKVDWLQFIPIVVRMPDGGVSAESVGAEQYGQFLCDVFDEWAAHGIGQMFIQDMEVAVGAWLNRPPGICLHAPVCGRNVAMEHNGDVYSCDHFVDPEHLLGNIHEASLSELVFSEEQRRFGESKETGLSDECRSCEFLFACRGGCIKDRFVDAPDGGAPRNYLCAGYRRFFGHIRPTVERIADLLRRGQPVTQAAVSLSAAPNPYAGAGRNDLCPCGSGRKFKKCHGAK